MFSSGGCRIAPQAWRRRINSRAFAVRFSRPGVRKSKISYRVSLHTARRKCLKDRNKQQIQRVARELFSTSLSTLTLYDCTSHFLAHNGRAHDDRSGPRFKKRPMKLSWMALSPLYVTVGPKLRGRIMDPIRLLPFAVSRSGAVNLTIVGK